MRFIANLEDSPICSGYCQLPVSDHALVKRLSISRIIFFTLYISLLAPLRGWAASPDPSAMSIVQNSLTVMSGTLTARQYVNSNESLVSQMLQSSGEVLYRVEPSFSNALPRRVLLRNVRGQFEIYPTAKIAINMRFQFEGLGIPHQGISTAGSPPPPGAVAFGLSDNRSLTLKGHTNFEGADCYRIEAKINPLLEPILRAPLTNLAAGDKLAFYEYLIRSDGYALARYRIVSKSGASLNVTTFRDVNLAPKLTEDLFELPPGLAVKEPKSITEYANLAASAISSLPVAFIESYNTPSPVSLGQFTPDGYRIVNKRQHLIAFVILALLAILPIVIICIFRGRKIAG